jgi:hypothetical protein
MNSKRAKLERQIRELERKIAAGGFRGVYDHDSRKHDEDRLKKLRKELEKLENE